jgi:hypothetical protein
MQAAALAKNGQGSTTSRSGVNLIVIELNSKAQ